MYVCLSIWSPCTGSWPPSTGSQSNPHTGPRASPRHIQTFSIWISLYSLPPSPTYLNFLYLDQIVQQHPHPQTCSNLFTMQPVLFERRADGIRLKFFLVDLSFDQYRYFLVYSTEILNHSKKRKETKIGTCIYLAKVAKFDFNLNGT